MKSWFFDVEYIYGFVWWGVCKHSPWSHSVTEPSEDSGHVLLWQRYDNNKMVAMRYYGNVSFCCWRCVYWACYRCILHLQQYSHRLNLYYFFSLGATTPVGGCILQPSSGLQTPRVTRFLDHIQRRATVGRTPLNEWSVRRRDLCLTTHNTHNRQTSMPRVGFEPTISAGEWSKTYALDRAATETGVFHIVQEFLVWWSIFVRTYKNLI